jgi:hypothetical protein
VTVRLAAGIVACALLVAASVAGSGAATSTDPSCGTSSREFAYGGYQATGRAQGVRAAITATRAPRVRAGHVAGWIGVGGPGQGEGGEDAWLQVGIAASDDRDAPFLYAELVRDGRAPLLVRLDDAVRVGERRKVAVVESPGRRSRWQVLVDGRRVLGPVLLRGSSGGWAPIATAESWNGGRGACNGFGFRFENVSVSLARGGAWSAFASGYRFLDRGIELRSLTRRPYSFTASS